MGDVKAVAWQPADLRDGLQRKCVEWDAYWRAPDAHGVVLKVEQATELLADAIGVEVEITNERLHIIAGQRDGAVAQHHRDSATLRRLCAERDSLTVQLKEYQQAAGMFAIEKAEQRQRAARLEADNARLREALSYAIDNPEFDSREFDKRARAALAEKEGGKT